MVKYTEVKFKAKDGTLIDTFAYEHPMTPECKEWLRDNLAMYKMLHPEGSVESHNFSLEKNTRKLDSIVIERSLF